jgi:cellulose biosynthesis protein BcsQ
MADNRSVCIASVKGGVGKTTTAYALACAGVAKGMMVAAIDLDGARSLTRALGMKSRKPTILDVLTRRASLEEAVAVSALGVFVVPGDRDLYRVGFEDKDLYRLHEELAEEADLVIIDTHPGEARLQVALELADVVVVPTVLDDISFDIAAETLRVAEECGALNRIGGMLASNFRLSNLTKMNLNLLSGLTQLDIAYQSFLSHAAAWPKAMAKGGRPGKKQMAEAQALLEEVLSRRCEAANLQRFLRIWEVGGEDRGV